MEQDPLVSWRTHVLNVIERVTHSRCPGQSYEDCIMGLDSAVLTQLWRRLWQFGTTRVFAETYNINQGNFTRWLTGKKSSAAAINATKQFLINGPPEMAPKVVPVAPPQGLSMVESLNRLGKRFEDGTIQALVLVDGDHAAANVARLATLMVDHHLRVEVVVVLTHNHTPATLLAYWHQPWLTVAYSETKAKDAADTVLSGLAYILAAGVLRNRSDRLHYLVASADGFAVELVAQLRLMGYVRAQLVPLNARVELDAWMYLTMPDLFTEEGEVIRSIVETTLGGFQTSTVKQFVLEGSSRLKRALDERDIETPYTPQQLAVAYLSSPVIKPYLPASQEEVDSLTPDELRYEFIMRWRGAPAVFGSRYKIGGGAVSSWMHKRLMTEPVVEAAVRQWLMQGGPTPLN